MTPADRPEDLPQHRTGERDHPDSKRVCCEDCSAVLPDSKALMVHVETAHVRGNL